MNMFIKIIIFGGLFSASLLSKFSDSFLWADNKRSFLTQHKSLPNELFWECDSLFVGLTKKSVHKSSSCLAHRFSLWDLAPCKGGDVTIVLIDTGLYSPVSTHKSFIKNHQVDLLKYPLKPYSYIANHGNHLYGIIAGELDDLTSLAPQQKNKIRRIGLAPHAAVIMIRAFKPDGTTELSTIIKALEIAKDQCKADIVCLGLKVGDEDDYISPLQHKCIELLSTFSFVIAAAGNDGDPYELRYVGNKLAFPSCHPCVNLSVGAFGMKNNQLFVPPFSQIKKRHGPKVLAPGVAIASTVILQDCAKERPAYLFMDGTSCAAAFVAGFVGLVFSEFRQDFTKAQLLTVIYVSCFASDDQLIGKSIYGVIDMRLTLFTLHVLRCIKRNSPILFMNKFNQIIDFIMCTEFKILDSVSDISSVITYCSNEILRRLLN